MLRSWMVAATTAASKHDDVTFCTPSAR
jgi:hypothetical protein